MALSFHQQMKAWAKKTGKTAGEHTVATRYQISKGTYQRTPVDTGRARASWIATTGNPSKRVVAEKEDYPSDETLLAAIKKKAGENIDGIFWLTNNLPYIRKLEYMPVGEGGSKQAPEGMVRVTLKEFEIGMEKLLK